MLALGAGAISMEAVAWWTDSGTGSAGAAVGTLSVPGTPAVSVVTTTATLSWAAATAPGAETVDYHVERRADVGLGLERRVRHDGVDADHRPRLLRRTR